MVLFSRFICFAGAVAVLVSAQKYQSKDSQTNEAGKEFLADMANKEGVKVLASGMMYEVLNKGNGAKHPLASTPCDCHYKGTLVDGTKFDSSYDRGTPTTFAPDQVIKGWTEAMQYMVEGDKWKMYIPAGLAYGSSGAGGVIPGGAALIFEMELIKIKGASVDAGSNPPKLDKSWHKDEL